MPIPIGELMMKKLTNKEIGALGEKFAADYLKRQKYKILDRNYKCRHGEIDIIACDGNEIVFVEVKTRSSDPYLPGMYAVDRKKQEHLLRAASVYLSATDLRLQPRMDVIEVELDDRAQPSKINHIKSAFIQTGDYARY